MPKLVGRSTRVVEVGGLSIDELAGNVASRDDTISIAKVDVSEPTSEPWLTLDYDEWICVLKGRVDLHSSEGVLTVLAGETAFVTRGERFRPVFPQANTEYLAVCLPAFKPERCNRAEEGVSDVSLKLRQLHANRDSALTCVAGHHDTVDNADKLYHMCERNLWEKALSAKEAYFPPTFEKDGNFTHATAIPGRLLDTANHFYTSTKGDWICIELSNHSMRNLGIITLFEQPKPVGDTAVDEHWTSSWQCPHIFGGIPGHIPGVVTNIYQMKRDSEGKFLSIEGLSS